RDPSFRLPRAAVRARSELPAACRQAGTARGLRAGGRSLREADTGERRRVPPQGADAPVVVGLPPHRPPATRRAATLRNRADLAPAPSLRQRHPPPRAAGDERRARRRGEGLPGGARRSGRLARARGGRKAAPSRPGGRARSLLLLDDRRDARLARPLPPLGPVADLGEGGRHALAQPVPAGRVLVPGMRTGP